MTWTIERAPDGASPGAPPFEDPYAVEVLTARRSGRSADGASHLRPARRWPGRAADPVRLAAREAVEELPDRGAPELLGDRLLGGVDHVLTALAAHPVVAHGGMVLCGGLDDHDLGPEATHLALLALEPPTRGAAGERGKKVERAVDRVPWEAADPAGVGLALRAARKRVQADDEVESAPRHEVHVRDGADAAVHVAAAADLDRAVEARDRAGGGDDVGDVRPRRAEPAERSAAAA